MGETRIDGSAPMQRPEKEIAPPQKKSVSNRGFKFKVNLGILTKLASSIMSQKELTELPKISKKTVIKLESQKEEDVQKQAKSKDVFLKEETPTLVREVKRTLKGDTAQGVDSDLVPKLIERKLSAPKIEELPLGEISIRSESEPEKKDIADLSSSEIAKEFKNIKSKLDQVKFLAEVCIAAVKVNENHESGLKIKENRNKITIATRLCAQREEQDPGFTSSFFEALIKEPDSDKVISACQSAANVDVEICNLTGRKVSELPVENLPKW